MWLEFAELLAQLGSQNALHWCPLVKHPSFFTQSMFISQCTVKETQSLQKVISVFENFTPV
jgi:hypothetical protein